LLLVVAAEAVLELLILLEVAAEQVVAARQHLILV
jgi:hypothetical protein